MGRPSKNIAAAGEFFMYSLWVQSQMSDLIILHSKPELIEGFVSNPSKIPKAMHQIRVKYWEKQFYSVKKEFIKLFADELSKQEINNLNVIYYLRNAIAHSHVSFGRDYFLYRPHKEDAVKKGLHLKKVKDQSDPMLVKLDFTDDQSYFRYFNIFKSFDEGVLNRIANKVGIPHSRIR